MFSLVYPELLPYNHIKPWTTTTKKFIYPLYKRIQISLPVAFNQEKEVICHTLSYDPFDNLMKEAYKRL